jgi:prepilin-type N-terminal cleavage/methylation domain-containing protein
MLILCAMIIIRIMASAITLAPKTMVGSQVCMGINNMSFFKKLNNKVLNSKGMTLIEVIVASVILAIIAVIVATAFLTMGNVSVKTADTKAADTGLESSIAAEAEENGYTRSAPVSGALQIPGSSGSATYNIPFESYTYSSDKTNQSFTVFGLESSGSGSTPTPNP